MGTVLKYYDAATGTWKPFTGDVPAPTASIVVKGNVTGAIDGVNKAFNTGSPYVAGTLQVYINGLPQSTMVAETSPGTGLFTCDVAPTTGSDIKVYYHLANTGLGNADTVDNFNASATPTANNLLVLDSNAKIPDAAFPAATTDANGWKVQNIAGRKLYTRKYVRTGSAAPNPNESLRLPSVNLPVGVAKRGDIICTYTARCNDRVWIVNERQGEGATLFSFEVNNWYAAAVTLNTVIIDIIAWGA